MHSQFCHTATKPKAIKELASIAQLSDFVFILASQWPDFLYWHMRHTPKPDQPAVRVYCENIIKNIIKKVECPKPNQTQRIVSNLLAELSVLRLWQLIQERMDYGPISLLINYLFYLFIC